MGARVVHLGQTITVHCRDDRCPGLACFRLTPQYIRSSVGASGVGSRTTGDYCCGHREAFNCPSETEPGDDWHRTRSGRPWVRRETEVSDG